MSDNVGDFLAHHGIKGMHWGHHKPEASGGGSGGGSGAKPMSRGERKVANLQNKATKVANKAKESDQRDKHIIDARNNIGKTASELKVAKAQYKVEKYTKGKAAAKDALKKVKDKHMANVHDANLMTAHELVQARNEAFQQVLIGQLGRL